MMVIKPTKGMIIHLIWPSILIFVLCILFYVKSQSVLFSLFPLAVLLCMTPWFISSLRTFVFDQNGCTVCLWLYKKQYSWDELKLKQYVHYKGAITRTTKASCFQAAEFCPKNVKIPKGLDGHAYSSIFHPLSFIFVYFPLQEDSGIVAYKINRDIFQSKLEEWGIEMRQSERGEFAYDPTWHEPK